MPVAAFRWALVETRDDIFTDDRRGVCGAVAEVDDPFSVGLSRRFHSERPVGGARAGMAEIVLDDRVAALEPVGCALERNVAGGSAAADAENLSVPVGWESVHRADC